MENSSKKKWFSRFGLNVITEILKAASERTRNQPEIETSKIHPIHHSIDGSLEDRDALDAKYFEENEIFPKTLLDGDLVRDDDGFYRSAEGEIEVIEDKKDSLIVKNDSYLAFDAAIQLAQAKGWNPIQISGNAHAQSQMWISAKLMGVEVINYTPTQQDMERYEERYAKREEDVEVEYEYQKILDEIEEEKINPRPKIVSEGNFSGKVLSIKDGIVTQRINRNGDTVAHDLRSFSAPVAVGDILDINYKDRKASIPEKEFSKGIGR